eukprot:CAMPEP_0183348370 /NCGR_PEP_ID=MMETSP0164_2-20130417/12894_1 /TAXON_ID=221442 /ORGANISM="Coccolithus pelagicus ssp braarudi, Strain PLY182g" /LENGTH=62 /DNA_ID=CAMNT_0025519947 /DNA_START=235 /DNA_END=423 /DNA_ORIENTATION=+
MSSLPKASDESMQSVRSGGGNEGGNVDDVGVSNGTRGGADGEVSAPQVIVNAVSGPGLNVCV